MSVRQFRHSVLTIVLLALVAVLRCSASEVPLPAALPLEGLGKGLAPLDGPWQFHLGDEPVFSSPATDDKVGQGGWEQLSADKTWGAQGHPAYVGYAWYRRHVHLVPSPGADPDVAMLVQHVDDVYEIYWNGVLVGHGGTMPPDPSYAYHPAPLTFGLGPVRDGVLAFRVWKGPLNSFDSDDLGGFAFAPVVGSPAAIRSLKAEMDYTWLRGRQYIFILDFLYGLVMTLSLLAWLRDRSQRVLLWMAVFASSYVGSLILVGLRLPISYNFALGWLQPVLSLQDIGLWFLLLWLLKLNDNPWLSKLTRLLAAISLAAQCLDGLLTMVDWSNPAITSKAQITDGVLTGIFTAAEAFPLVLVFFALRKRLDSARWIVAIAAATTEMLSVVRIAAQQGSRFTHWTLGTTIGNPLFTVNGIGFNAQAIAGALLLLAILYAVYQYIQEAGERQTAMEQEFKSARELQQLLIPETLPALSGYAVTSAYRPAQEVGGDFFQILPLDGESAGSTLIVLGDVSGKGLKAAMTVSLIVGAVRTLAEITSSPAEILSGLNRRLHGRMQEGFATCLALRMEPDGRCVVASAGHPAPFLNRREVDLPGALPLGLIPHATYEEQSLELVEGDHFSLYTDGLLEARNATGEIFSFRRLEDLFATLPNAAEASAAAVAFGQDDDITVLTLIRLAYGVESTTHLSAPALAPA